MSSTLSKFDEYNFRFSIAAESINRLELKLPVIHETPVAEQVKKSDYADSSEPRVPTHAEDIDRDLICIIDNGRGNSLGHIGNKAFVKMEESRFFSVLEPHVKSVSFITDDNGHFEI